MARMHIVVNCANLSRQNESPKKIKITQIRNWESWPDHRKNKALAGNKFGAQVPSCNLTMSRVLSM